MSRKIFSTEVEIEGYTLFHKDRIGRRGGASLYVQDSLQCCVNNVIKTRVGRNKTNPLVFFGGEYIGFFLYSSYLYVNQFKQTFKK